MYIKLTEMIAHINGFRRTNYMSFFMKDDELRKNTMEYGVKSQEKNLMVNRSTKKSICKLNSSLLMVKSLKILMIMIIVI